MQRVVIFSESTFTIEGHGVHAAFTDCQQILDKMTNVQRAKLWSLQPSDVLHVHSAGPMALALLLYHTGPKVITAHITPESFSGSIAKAGLLQMPIEHYLEYFYAQADLVLAVSNYTVDYLRDIHVQRIRLLPNTVDTEAFSQLQEDRPALRKKLGWHDERPVVLSVGQVQPRKGVDEFIDVARKMPEANFIWVGGFLFGALSADRARLQHVMASAPDNVLFTGPLPRESVFEYYAAADLFTSLSYQETFGLAILEAAAAGLPLVLRDLPLYRFIFDESYIPVPDDDYYTPIAELIQNERKRVTYGSIARHTAMRYRSSKYGEELVDAYSEASRIAKCRLTDLRLLRD
jgi:1,2-diacylglycerol-3-alpha-glucose alpha-1,2-galactosyltransferase